VEFASYATWRITTIPMWINVGLRVSSLVGKVTGISRRYSEEATRGFMLRMLGRRHLFSSWSIVCSMSAIGLQHISGVANGSDEARSDALVMNCDGPRVRFDVWLDVTSRAPFLASYVSGSNSAPRNVLDPGLQHMFACDLYLRARYLCAHTCGR
jgi:hypothetical protein